MNCFDQSPTQQFAFRTKRLLIRQTNTLPGLLEVFGKTFL